MKHKIKIQKSVEADAAKILRLQYAAYQSEGWIDEELANAVLPQMPLGKLIEPQDIAETVLFLASERVQW